MKQLWAPWRIDYILGPKPDTCVFCLPQGTEEDAERLVLYRGEHCFVIMNKYPYNNGHIMVCPYRHVMLLAELSRREAHEIMDLFAGLRHYIKGQLYLSGHQYRPEPRRGRRAPAFGSICTFIWCRAGTGIPPLWPYLTRYAPCRSTSAAAMRPCGPTLRLRPWPCAWLP